MREIIKSYGMAALAMVCVGAVLLLLMRNLMTVQGHTGAYAALEEILYATDKTEMTETKSRAAITQAKTGELPLVVNGSHLIAGKAYSVSEVLLVENAEEDEVNIRILHIYQKGTEEEMTDAVWNQDTGQLLFPEAGLYVFQIYVSDTKGATVGGDVYVNVN
jgi:hypothetical protein